MKNRDLEVRMHQLTRLSVIVCCLLSTAQAQTYLGNYTSYAVEGKAIIVRAASAAVRFIFYRSDVLRVDFLPTETTALDSSLVVIQDTTESVGFSVIETDSSLQIASSAIKVICRKSPLRAAYYDASEQLLLAEPLSGGLGTNQAQRIATFSLGPNDHFYGTGERGTSLDKRGQAFDSYNTQVFGYTTPLATMNINVPFLASTNGYALYFENTYPGRFDLGASDPTRFSYKALGGELSLFLIVAPTVPGQLETYTWLTGHQPLPPRWAFGYIQSKFGYRIESEARGLVQTMRQKQIPSDAIIIDAYWFNHMGDLSWNRSAWPEPFQMMQDFLDQGMKTIVITEPYIVVYSSNFSPAVGIGLVGKDPVGQPYFLNNWWSCGCDAVLLDLSNPTAQSWWWNKHPAFFGDQLAPTESGLAGIWTDLGEPERHPDDMQHYLGGAPRVHNIFNLLWAKTIFEGFGEFRPNDRIFNLTRSGYAGIQRYGVILWSGDVGTDFGGLAVQLPMLLNMGMSGLAYHNSDIGGFCCGTTAPELYVRWMQYGTFCPVTRAHGADYQPKEPWGYGAEAERISKEYIQLRYQLLPYIYTMAYENYATGLPLARPLFFDDPDDMNLVNESSSYLWGDAFLVSPVVQAGQTTKTVYLPRGRWVDYWTDEVIEGGRSVTVSAPLETMPLFVKSGSVIPMQSVMNYTDERPLDTLMLAMYPSLEQQGRFTLYEDDGKTLAYRSGSFARTSFVQNVLSSAVDTTLTIGIGGAQGTYEGKPLQRVYLSEVHGIARSPTAVRKNGLTVPERLSYEELRQAGDGFFYDSVRKRLVIHTPTNADSAYQLLVEDIQLVTSVSDGDIAHPRAFHLHQNYPNPFNPTTAIRYDLADASYVTLRVYDVLGRELATLVNEVKPAGEYQVQFDVNAVSAKAASSGVYFYRLAASASQTEEAKVFLETRKMVVVK